MKALSIREPYAFAITMGFKPVENRTWATSYRGPVLIHAGKREQADDVEAVLRRIAAQTGAPYTTILGGYRGHRHLGCIVGGATLTDCVTEHPSEWFFGPFGFVLENPTWGNPVPCRGALGLFDVPADVLDRLVLPPYYDCTAA